MNDGGIYLYGMTLLTTSHRLAADFPSPDHYCEIAESHRLPGGETGTCAVVLAGLGLEVRIDGNHLGRSTYPDLSNYFEPTTVSLDLMTYDPDFEGLEDLVFIDQSSRTSFGRFCAFYADRSVRRWNSPSEDAIKQASVVGLDPFFFEDSVRAAELCAEHNVKFITIDCEFDTAVHALSAVNVLAAEYIRDRYPKQNLESLFAEYVERTSGLVIFTFGADELWFGRAGHSMQRFKPYQVDVKSTLGAGDSFKAGVIYAISKGTDDATLVRFASATAAAACSAYPIAEYPPTLARVGEIAGESLL